MYEIWTYAVSPAEDKVYYAVWGGGVLEYDQKTERWKDYNDPDGETEMVVMKDQGLIHEITTSVSYVDKILVGRHLLRREPLRRPLLAQLPDQRQRPAQQLPEPDQRRSTPIAPGSRPTKDWPTTTARTGRSIVLRSIPTSRKCWCAMRPEM